jgi:septal ring factor EnvC (AmiA/AmiB activator)
MRKRHVIRPVLESMEVRLALSALGAVTPTAEVHTTRLAKVEAHKTQEAAAHAAKHDTTAKHHKTAKPTKTTSKTSSTSGFSSAVSNFFKSAFSGL